jgi:hypothetical protein
VHQNLERSMDQKRAALPCCDGRIEENAAAAVADFRRRTPSAWRLLWLGKKRGKERRWGLFVAVVGDGMSKGLKGN